MAASDYTLTGAGQMLAHASLDGPIAELDSSMTISGLTSNSENAPTVGSVAMVGDEFCRVSSVAGVLIGIERGCADTIPQAHPSGTEVWFFTNNLGSDRVTYAAGTTVGVKVLPFTSGGEVPVDAAPPHTVSFNWRHARPYPPGNVKCNGQPWFSDQFLLTSEDPTLDFTWAHRDRLLQLDQLIGHTASDIGPEAGVTYRVEVLRSDLTVARVVSDIAANSWQYTKENATIDFGSIGSFEGYVRLTSVRGDLDSLYSYSTAIQFISEAVVVPTSAIYPFSFANGLAMAVENFGDTHSKVFESSDEGLNFTEVGDGSRLTNNPYEFSALRVSDGSYISVLGEKAADVNVLQFRMVRGVIGSSLPADTTKVFTRSMSGSGTISVSGETVVCVGCNGVDFVALVTPNLVYSSSDGGVTWTNAGTFSLPGLPGGFTSFFTETAESTLLSSNWFGSNMSNVDGRWFMASSYPGDNLFFNDSAIPTGTWTRGTLPLFTIVSFAVGIVKFAGALFVRATRYNKDLSEPDVQAVAETVLKSIDNGVTWTEVYAKNSITNPYSELFVINGSMVAIARDYGAKKLSSVDGVTWVETNTTLQFVPSEYRPIRYGTKIATLGLQIGDTPYPMKITGIDAAYTNANFTYLPDPSGLGNDLGNNLGGTP